MDHLRLLPLALIAALALACGSDDPDNDSSEDACSPPSQASWETSIDDHESGAFMSVWGPSTDRVLTVGGQPEQGTAYHFDQDQWTPLELPEGPMLNWVHGSDDVFWLVGNEGRILRLEGDPQDPDVLQTYESPTDKDLWGVWVHDHQTAWAVGGDARDFDAQPVLLRYDGYQWHDEPLPEFDRDANSLFKIWGTGPDHIFAVGALGLILHYDGDEWQQVSTGASDDFVSLWGRADDEIVAVGGRANAQIARFDGDAWSSEIVGGQPGLNGIWMDCQGRSHVNGVDGRALTLDAASTEPSVESTPTSTVLHASFGFNDGPRFAVGGTLQSSPPYQGTILISAD